MFPPFFVEGTKKIYGYNFVAALNLDQWKTFSENHKPIRAWLWLVYKFTDNSCHSRLFSDFIQTEKRYPTSLDKIIILTWKLLDISSQTLSCKLNSQGSYSLQISHICRCFCNITHIFLKVVFKNVINDSFIWLVDGYWLLYHPNIENMVSSTI